MSAKDGGVVKIVMPLEVPGGRRVGLSEKWDVKLGECVDFAESLLSPEFLLEGDSRPTLNQWPHAALGLFRKSRLGE